MVVNLSDYTDMIKKINFPMTAKQFDAYIS